MGDDRKKYMKRIRSTTRRWYILYNVIFSVLNLHFFSKTIFVVVTKYFLRQLIINFN